MQGLYESVEDIDLYTGLTQETPEADDGMVSRTFRCLIHDQFARLKKGDRYFYDLEGQGGSFKLNQVQFQFYLLWGLHHIFILQLDEIRRVSMSRLICDNTDQITIMQPLAFRKLSEW